MILDITAKLKKIIFPVLNDNFPMVTEKIRFYYHHHYIPNLNNPKTFNEKILKRKLIDRDNSFFYFSDKVNVKKYVENEIGSEYLIRTLGVYDEITLSDFDDIELPFVIKCNHDSGSVRVIKNKSEINIDLVNFFNKRTYYSTSKQMNEYWYGMIQPKILIEEFVGGISLSEMVPNDFKFHVFNNSEEIYLHIDYDRFQDRNRTIYDVNGDIVDVSINCNNLWRKLPDVENLDLMFQLAKKLAKNVNNSYVRVDFYNVNGQIYFGEFTFAPGAGFSKFNPRVMDYKWGNLWK